MPPALARPPTCMHARLLALSLAARLPTYLHARQKHGLSLLACPPTGPFCPPVCRRSSTNGRIKHLGSFEPWQLHQTPANAAMQACCSSILCRTLLVARLIQTTIIASIGVSAVVLCQCYCTGTILSGHSRRGPDGVSSSGSRRTFADPSNASISPLSPFARTLVLSLL